MDFYNEWDRKTAAWLRELVRCGHVPSGTVDERSIRELQPHELSGYRQVHLFAGIGGWPLAIKLAGWPDDREIWTGSCPCQPFSNAGSQHGESDERHLWPEMFRLIRERMPATVFGEQVASRAGRGWLAGVRADLESLGYAVGAADLCAAGEGSPHIRQRLFWVAHATQQRPERFWSEAGQEVRPAAPSCRETGGLGADRLGYSNEQRPQGLAGQNEGPDQWSDFDIVHCRDNSVRRIEPSTFPLAHGLPARVGRLCGYGNAIVPQVAARFVKAFMTVNG